MKFIHIADVHLGAEPDAGAAYSAKRPEELWETFAAVTEICEKEKTDLLLIAGDLFHRQPLKRELREVNYYFSRLSHTKVVLIAGNHDYLKPDSSYRSFAWSSNVYPLFDAEPECVIFEELETAVTGFSYHEREIREGRYDRLKKEGDARYEILLAHGGDEKHIPIRKECLSQSGFDYIALGHIHRQQTVIPGKAAYAGSLEPTDKNDTGRHGYIRGELSEDGTSFEFVPFAGREYLHLAVQISPGMTSARVKDELKKIVDSRGKENLYKFILRGYRDPDMEFEPDRMRVYGNILEIADETLPAYDFEKLRKENKDNLLGKYIETFSGCGLQSIEYEALCEGVRALMENRQKGVR